MFAKKQSKLETIIGPESCIKGEISSTGTVRIDGAVEGNISAEWVIIGESGVINGDIKSKGMIIGGKVIGNIRSTEIVEIKQKGEVCGEIYTSNLTILEGAIFEGRSYMQRSKEIEYKAVEASVVK